MTVFIVASVTVDGFIAQASEQSSLEWTSREDTQLFVRLTKEAGVMVMGSTTFATIGRALPGRKTYVYTSKPEKVAGIENVEATSVAPADLVRRISEEGYDRLAVCGGSKVYRQFIEAGVVDELYITVEPIVFGAGVPLLDLATTQRLSLLDTQQLNDDTILLHYQVLH